MLWALDEKERADLAAGSEAQAKRKAEDNATAALTAADKAERAAYQAQMISAGNAVEHQRMDGAGVLLAATPARLRGWEYQHLTSRLDRSLPTPFPADWKVSRISRASASGVTAVSRMDQGRPPGWAVLSADLRTERFTLADTVGYSALAISPDGSRGVWIPLDGADVRPATLWELETGTLITTIPIQGSRDNLFATWSPRGDRFIICRDARFEVYEGRSGSLLEAREAEGWVVFTQDSRWMLQGRRTSSDLDRRTLRLLDAHTFEPGPETRHVAPASSAGPHWTSFWQSCIASSSADGTLQVLDIADGVLRPRFKIAPGMGVLTVPAWSPDGRLIAVGTAEGGVGVWETDSQTPRGEFAGPQSAITGVMFLPASGDIWACNLNGQHGVWPLGSAAGGVLTAHKSFVYPVQLSKDGGLLLTGGWDGYFGQSGGLKLWDPRTGALLAEHGKPGEVPWSASLTPDGRYAVAGYFAHSPPLRRTDVIDLWSGRVAQTFRR